MSHWRVFADKIYFSKCLQYLVSISFVRMFGQNLFLIVSGQFFNTYQRISLQIPPSIFQRGAPENFLLKKSLPYWTRLTPPPKKNSNGVPPCEKFLKTRDFLCERIYTGRRRFGIPGGKYPPPPDPPPQTQTGDPLRKSRFEFGGGVLF